MKHWLEINHCGLIKFWQTMIRCSFCVFLILLLLKDSFFKHSYFSWLLSALHGRTETNFRPFHIETTIIIRSCFLFPARHVLSETWIEWKFKLLNLSGPKLFWWAVSEYRAMLLKVIGFYPSFILQKEKVFWISIKSKC